MTRNVERISYRIGALLLLSGLIHLGILSIGGGPWLGPLSLRKAVTFGFSFGLTVITITWVSGYLQLADRTRHLLLTILSSASVLETGLVSLQAWRGVPSHFNLETPLDANIARALAAGGFTIVVVIAVLTFIAFRTAPATPAPMRVAIRTGFVILMAAMATGAAMIAKGMALVFAGNPEAAYLTGGTLKPTHAITVHAILVLPLLAALVSRTGWGEQRQRLAILLASVGYALVAAVVTAGNLAGIL